MDPNQSNDGSQGGFSGANMPPYPAAWNPYMYGYQAPSSWFPQGFQQVPPHIAMGQQGSSVQQVSPLAENIEVDEVDEVEPQLSPEHTGKRKSRKKCVTRIKLGNFNPDEDTYLVKSWLEISTDPVTSTGQKSSRMWERILDRYNLKRGSNPERTVRSLQSRWDIIKGEVGKFAAFHADATRENPSGMSDSDKTTLAAANFAAVCKHNFPYMHCWNIMKYEPKWQDPKPRSVPKSVGGENDATINLGDGNGSPGAQAEERPPGRDTSKVPKKKANSDAGSASSSEWSARMQDLTLQRISFMQEESVRKSDRFQQLACIDEKRFEEMRSHNKSLLECEQQKTRIMVEKHEREKQKEEQQEDERILAIDLDACQPNQRMYYQVLQEEIMAKMQARCRKRQSP